MPVPAPTAPCSTELPAFATAWATSESSTCTTRASLSQLSSHSPTTGMTTLSTPTAGSASRATATAPSITRPTAWVDVRYTGVSRMPHSRISREPVSSPAPLRTAVPAGTGFCSSEPIGPGRIAVTPVRATVHEARRGRRDVDDVDLLVGAIGEVEAVRRGIRRHAVEGARGHLRHRRLLDGELAVRAGAQDDDGPAGDQRRDDRGPEGGNDRADRLHTHQKRAARMNSTSQLLPIYGDVPPQAAEGLAQPGSAAATFRSLLRGHELPQPLAGEPAHEKGDEQLYARIGQPLDGLIGHAIDRLRRNPVLVLGLDRAQLDSICFCTAASNSAFMPAPSTTDPTRVRPHSLQAKAS